LGALAPAAIERVREEARPAANTADELHDALLLAGFVRSEETSPGWHALFDELVAAGRACDAGGYWISVERFDELNAIVPQVTVPAIPERLRKSWTREDAARELVRGRTEVLGPVTARALADSLGLPDTALIDGTLLALENEGKLLRGRFTGGAAQLEWCDRRLLARIHRYTLNRLRAERADAARARRAVACGRRTGGREARLGGARRIRGAALARRIVLPRDRVRHGAAAQPGRALPRRAGGLGSRYGGQLRGLARA